MNRSKTPISSAKGWYQEELTKAEALDRIENGKLRQASTPPTYPLYA